MSRAQISVSAFSVQPEVYVWFNLPGMCDPWLLESQKNNKNEMEYIHSKYRVLYSYNLCASFLNNEHKQSVCLTGVNLQALEYVFTEI